MPVRKVFQEVGRCIILVFVFSTGYSRSSNPGNPFYELKDTRWADSVLQTLSPDERIAQLFMVAAYSDRDKKHQNVQEVKKLIREYKIGGLIFFHGGPLREAMLTNSYQELSRVPLLVSMDAEWGLGMRLDSTVRFPHQMSLGAMQDDSLVYAMGAEIARQCRRLGIQVDLAPVVDINSNPLNPVISNRSFGENKYSVARKAVMYMKGLQDNGVMASAKHFPGHGDTDSDSHKTLPVINHSEETIDTLDLFPFKQLIGQGLSSLMVAHLYIPSLDTTRNTASTLSKKIVTGLLKEKLNFQGLVFTDALNMKGVSKYFSPGEVDLKALLAGNDVLLFSENVPVAIAEIKQAIGNKEISQEDIDRRCRKILIAKQWCGLNKVKPVDLKNLYRDLNTPGAELINRRLVESSLTLLQNKGGLVPLQRPDTLRIAALSLGSSEVNGFQEMLGNYSAVSNFGLDAGAKAAAGDSVIKWMKAFNLVIVQVNNTVTIPSKNFGISPEEVRVLQAVIHQGKTIVNVSANPYVLSKLEGLQDADAVIMSYEDNELTGSLSAQLIFGAVSATGRLPVTSSEFFKAGMGIDARNIGRLKFTIPEELGIDRAELTKIDSIALDGIKDKVYPGCQVLVAKDGKVFYDKSFGYHTYARKIPVLTNDIYDLASVTKIAATTPAVMTLVQEKKLNLDDSLYHYLPELKGTNKQNIVIREMMVHQAGLRDWIPFWMHTVKKGQYIPGIYSKTPSNLYSLRVAEDLFINKNYADTIYAMITRSEVKGEGKYRYSDLGYYYLKKIVEKETKMPLDDYMSKTFYRPLGLTTMGYKPREHFDLDRIPPTEKDKTFRKQLIHGDVHDQGAAMLGGVGGHAGLFSDAFDLAVMMQLFLQKGEYGGRRYLDTAVVSEFTRCQYCLNNRRAIGFDKPDLDSPRDNPVCSCVSALSFGHSGFTGTLTWADPAKNLVYVFLSNRVYPRADVNKLVKKGTRTKIQEVIYNAIK